MGVFKRYDDVPDHHRLASHASDYEGRDVWGEFCEEYEFRQGNGDYIQDEIDRAGGHWLDHMRTRERHHALASPADVEAWSQSLIEDTSVATAFHYWIRVRRFYDWLLWHVEHPHVYNPMLMAAADGPASGRIWERKLAKWRMANGGGDD